MLIAIHGFTSVIATKFHGFIGIQVPSLTEQSKPVKT